MIQTPRKDYREMMGNRKFVKLILISISLLLTACANFQVGIEPSTPPSQIPSPVVLAASPIPPTDMRPVPQAAASLPALPSAATSQAAPYAAGSTETSRPRQPVKIIQTHMLDAQSGWGVGQVETDLVDHVLFTVDGGQTWQDRSPRTAQTSAPVDGLTVAAYFFSAEVAWISYTSRTPSPVQGSQLIWFTTDAGRTWTSSQPLDFGESPQEFYLPSDLGTLDGKFGWIMVHMGAGMNHDYISIFTTADAGKTWTRVLDPQTGSQLMSCRKTGLVFTSSTSGWLVGDCPGLMPSLFLYRTQDGGYTWTPLSLPAPDGQPANFFEQANFGCGIRELAFASPRTALLPVTCTRFQDNTGLAWLYSSTDNGQSWVAYSLPLPYDSFKFISPSEGWLLGSSENQPSHKNQIQHTSDGGRTWLPVSQVQWQGGIDFVDSQNGWVVATLTDVSGLVRSSDGGKNWQQISPTLEK